MKHSQKNVLNYIWNEYSNYTEQARAGKRINPRQLLKGIPRWLSGKEYTAKAGDVSSIPGLGRSPGGGTGNPLQYSYLENSMDRGSWQSMDLQRVWHDWTTEHNPTQVRFTPVIAICWLYVLLLLLFLFLYFSITVFFSVQ